MENEAEGETKPRWRFTDRKSDLARKCRVHPRTIENWVRAGIIPASAYMKIGHVVRFDLREVESALVEHQRKAVAS